MLRVQTIDCYIICKRIEMFTTKEIDAVRFYQGDTRRRMEDGRLSDKEMNKGFFGTQHAYRTMNCLMYDGIDNEIERFTENNNCLNSELFQKVDKIIEVFCDIYRAMCKNVINNANAKNILVYRAERGVSIRELKKGYTISFTSTSKENQPEEFLLKKIDLTLLEIVFDAKLPHLDFEEILGKDYYYKEQREILLPPFLKIDLKEMELTKDEQRYKDANGHPPCAKYLVWVKNEQSAYAGQVVCQESPLTVERNEKSAKTLEKIVRKEHLTNREIEEYSKWKSDVRAVIWNNFQQIHSEYFPKEVSNQKELLIEDIKNMIKEFDSKRKKYKKIVRWCNFILIVTNTIPLACMTLSFVESIQEFMKIAAVITSTVSILISQILKVEVYDLKLQQRSRTYLRLCDLNREIKFEKNWNQHKEEEYIRKYRQIMQEDAEMSLHNVKMQAENAGNLYQSEIKQGEYK